RPRNDNHEGTSTMNLWTQLFGGNVSWTTKRRTRQARPGLETMEIRTLLNAGPATFRLVDGFLLQKHGRHQSLVATNGVSWTFVNRRTIRFVEQNGDIFQKTVNGAPKLIAHGNASPMPNVSSVPGPTPNPNPNQGPVHDWFSQNLANAGIASLARTQFARD